MRHFIYTAALVFVVGLFGPAASFSAHAQDGLAQQMQDTFGSMVSTTEPQVVTNSSRGVISGGNFTVKNKVMAPDLYSLQLPRIKAGCGGWDIFGGSFSFISSEQVVAMLRSIAASAIGYAFKLALQQISDDISNTLEGFWKDLSFTNFMGKSSCELGSALVDSLKASGASTLANQAAANKMTGEGKTEDHTDSKFNMKPKSAAAEQATTDAASPDINVRTAIVKGNHIINAFRKQGDWTAFGGDRFAEDIQSITGTYIMCVNGVNGCPSDQAGTKEGQDDVVKFARGPLMTLHQAVKGRMKYSTVKRWKCNDTDCLNPVETSDGNYKGTEELLRTALLGPNNAPGEGLIGKYARNQGTWTPAEEGIISAGGDFVSMAMNLAVHNERDGRDFVNAFIEIIAADITYRVIEESLTKVQAAVSSVEGGGMVESQELVDKARLRIAEELKLFNSQGTASTAKWDYFNSLTKARPPVRVPALSVTAGK